MGGCGFWRVRVRVHVKIPPGYPCRSLRRSQCHHQWHICTIKIEKYSADLSAVIGGAFAYKNSKILRRSQCCHRRSILGIKIAKYSADDDADIGGVFLDWNDIRKLICSSTPLASPTGSVKDRLQPVSHRSLTSRSKEATGNRTDPNLEGPATAVRLQPLSVRSGCRSFEKVATGL